MQEIANGTFNYQQLNEIMPMIYKRFTEKAAEEWRQIYKVRPRWSYWKLESLMQVAGTATSRIPDQKRLRARNRRCPIPPVPTEDAPPIPLHRSKRQGPGH
jgi:ENTH domain